MIHRYIRLVIFLGILFSFAWLFRWDLEAGRSGGYAAETFSERGDVGFIWLLDRWTGNIFYCRRFAGVSVTSTSCLAAELRGENNP